MDLTALLGLGKPAGGENYSVAVPNNNMDLIDAAVLADRNRLDALEIAVAALGGGAGDTTALAGTLITGVNNWTFSGVTMRYAGNMCMLQFVAERSVITGSSSTGGIANIQMGTWAAAMANYKPPMAVGIAPSTQGVIWSGWVDNSGIYLNALLADEPLPSGDSIAGTAVWIRDMP